MYNRRSKMNPLWNQVLVTGFEKGEPYLGYVDLHGTNHVENYIATGMGFHVNTPILRNTYKPDMTEAEARKLLTTCLEVCFARDCYASNEVQFGKVDASGISIEAPVRINC